MENFFKDEEVASPQPLPFVQSLSNAWSNEKRAPELLRFEASAVAQAHAFLAERTPEALATLSADVRDIYQLDVDRVAYVLKSYLRFRLFKLQKYYAYYLNNESAKLSSAELKFAEGIARLNKSHMHATFLHCLPEEEVFLSITGDGMIRTPEFSSFVFAKVVQTVGTVVCGSENYELVVERGKTYLVKYADIKMFVEQGKMVLV